MTFVYCNVARPLYTRGQSRARGFENNLRNLDIPRMRERTNVAGIQIGIGIQRIPGAPNGRSNPLEKATLARSRYMHHVRIRVIARLRRDSSDSCAHRVRRRCAYNSGCIAPRRSRQKQDLRAVFPTPIVAYKYRMQCIRYYKAFPITSSNCEPAEFQAQFIAVRLFRCKSNERSCSFERRLNIRNKILSHTKVLKSKSKNCAGSIHTFASACLY